MKIPLAEHFHSIQGEGYWAGTPMHFIRLPGCSVGKPQTLIAGHEREGPPKLPTGKSAWLCHTSDSRPFWCDTDFGKYEEVDTNELMSETWENHICITGGEPLIYREIIDWFRVAVPNSRLTGGMQLHIETSGTIPFWWEADLHISTHFGNHDWRDPWLTVSPKVGWQPYMIKFADELKLLVHADTKLEDWDYAIRSHPRTYLSPINDVWGDTINTRASISSRVRAQELLRLRPDWKLSVQLHKYLGVK